MKRFTLIACAAVVAMIALAQSASAGGPLANRRCPTCWHGPYYDTTWGAPVALVVPPTAKYQTHWNWGVGGTQVTPIRPQFQRAYPGPGQYDPRTMLPTPPWPSSTDQFGDYYVRGPW
jgi:hypothetical protein